MIIINDKLFIQLERFIQQYETFSNDELDRLKNLFRERNIKKGTEIVKQGQQCKSLWFINEGSFRAFSINSEGNEHTTDFAFENQFMTSFKSYRTKSESNEFIVAIEDSILLEANIDSVESAQKHLPSFKSAILKIIEFAFICMEERNYSLQNFSAEERYLDLLENGDKRILERVPLVHISSYLGISSETLSRVRRKIIS